MTDRRFPSSQRYIQSEMLARYLQEDPGVAQRLYAASMHGRAASNIEYQQRQSDEMMRELDEMVRSQTTGAGTRRQS